MRNEHLAVSTDHKGSRFTLATFFSLSSILLAGAMIACGGSPAAITPIPTPAPTPAPAAVVLTSVTVSPDIASISVGSNKQFSAIGHYSDGSEQGLPFVTWSASSLGGAQIATVLESDLGLTHGVTPGQATIFATDTASNLSGKALLTITAPTLDSVTITPATASIPVGFFRQFALVGHYSNGAVAPLTGASWVMTSASASIDANGLANALKAGGPATITATDPVSGSTATATLTVTPELIVTPVPASSPQTVDSIGVSLYSFSGLDATAEYLVSLTPPDQTLLAQVAADKSFATPACDSFAGGPACRARFPNSAGELFVMVTGNAGKAFTLDVKPLPVLQANAPLAGTVDTTEAYYKVLVAAGSVFDASLAGLSDDAELVVYSGPHGVPLGITPVLCESRNGADVTDERCVGTSTSGVVYVTVEGWLTHPELRGAVATTFTQTVK